MVSCLRLQQRFSKSSRSTHATAAHALLLQQWLVLLLVVVSSRSSSSSQGTLLCCSSMQQARERPHAQHLRPHHPLVHLHVA